MAISRVFPLYINHRNRADPLLTDATSGKRASSLVLTQGDAVTLRIYFVDVPGNPPSYVVPVSTDTVILAANKAPDDETPTFQITEWTRTATYIEGALDAGVLDAFWAGAAQRSRTLTCDIEIRNQGNTGRVTYQFPIVLRRQVHGSGTTPDTITPYLDLTAALGVFVAVDRAQSLTTPEQEQGRQNLGAVAAAGGTLTNVTFTGTTTFGNAGASVWRGNADIDDDSDNPFSFRVRSASTFRVVNDSDAVLFSVTAGGTVTVAGALGAGSVRTAAIHIPQDGGLTIFDKNGFGIFTFSDDGELVLTSIDVNLISVGGHSLTLGGTVSFGATGRALASAADEATAFDSIKQAATATATGVTREWLRTTYTQLSSLAQAISGSGASTLAFPIGYNLQSGTTSTTGYAARRSAPSNNCATWEGKSAGTIPWGSITVEGEILLLFATGWDSGAVFRLHHGRTSAQPTGNTAHATHPHSYEIRYEAGTALKVIACTAAATTTVTSTFTPTLGVAFRLRWKVSGGTILVWVNGTLVATATGGPTSDSGATSNVFHMGVENASTVSVSSEVKASIPVLDIY